MVFSESLIGDVKLLLIRDEAQMLQAFVSGFECGREARDFTPHGVKELVIGLVALRELMLVPRGPMIARLGFRDKTVVIPLPGASVPLTRYCCEIRGNGGDPLEGGDWKQPNLD